MVKTTPTCGDTSCIFGHIGMGTNGGCRCLNQRMTLNDVVSARRRVRMLRARAEAAEARAEAAEDERDALALRMVAEEVLHGG